MRRLQGDKSPPATSAEENRIERSQVKAANKCGKLFKITNIGRTCAVAFENDLFIYLLCRRRVSSAHAFLHDAFGLMARHIKGGAACWRNEL